MMKALALSQPWAELLISGKKKIETRNKNTSHRGWFYVYACKSGTSPDILKDFGFDSLPTGMVIGKAFINAVKRYDTFEDFAADANLHLATKKELESEGWGTAMPKYGYIISKTERIEPVPFRGMPGFFNINM